MNDIKVLKRRKNKLKGQGLRLDDLSQSHLYHLQDIGRQSLELY